jgi:hypothetical protein
MKTHEEFLAEARRIEAIGSLYADEHRRAALAGGALRPRMIPTFLTPPALPRERWLEAEMIDGAIEYRLVETNEARRETGATPRVLFASDSAFDVLVEADEIEEKEALTEKLAPVVERIGRHEFDDSIELSVVQEIEAMFDAGELDPAAQLKTRAEIVEFLAGEIEPSRLAAAIVERRRHRESLHETLTLRCDERRITQEL